jgi:hypothetical protein
MRANRTGASGRAFGGACPDFEFLIGTNRPVARWCTMSLTVNGGTDFAMREFGLGEIVRHTPTGTVGKITLIDEGAESTTYHVVSSHDQLEYELRACRSDEIARVVERRRHPRRTDTQAATTLPVHLGG